MFAWHCDYATFKESVIMRKVSSFSIGALAVLLLTLLLLGCGGGRNASSVSNLKSMPEGRTVDLNAALAELDALQAPPGVDPVIFQELKDSLRGALIARGKIVCTPSTNPVNDLVELTPATDPPTIAWSANFFRGDGSGDGAISVADLSQLAMEFNDEIATEPTSMYADYDDSGKVGVSDITTIAMGFGWTTASYNVEWSETETGTYALAGNVLWGDALPDLNANNFKVWNYQFNAGVLPAVASVWVRVTPLDSDGVLGVPCAPIEVPLTTIPPRDFYITGIRVNVSNTVNTDAADLVNIGTTRYVAPAGGGDTFADVASNTVILVDLEDVFYRWKGNNYTPDDPLPADLTQTELDAFIADAKAYMSYLVLSIDSVEGWTPSATQPPTGYEGRIGPNDDLDPPNVDGGVILATMADNDMTQGSAGFQVPIVYDQTVDPNAPEVVAFSPTEQPQNINTTVHTLRIHFGADETLTEVPDTVALLNKATGAVAYTFAAAATPETPASPTTPGEYTYQWLASPGSSMFVRVMVPASQLTPGIEYVWRVSEDVAGFELKSSRYKPGGVFTLIGPDLFDMVTWPEEEYYWDDVRAPYLYFFPQDPIIRRNPMGDMDDPSAQFPQWEWDDPAAANDIVKNSGEEFMIVFGERPPPPDPPLPDSPMVYYNFGDVAPPSIGEADGQLPIALRQPHMLGGIAGLMPDTSGNYSFSLFSKEGTYLGSVTRYNGFMPIIRSAPYLDATADFGVRPWGFDGSNLTPDFSDKAASRSSNDVVVFTFYNLWLRHDDHPGLPQVEQGTRVILTDVTSTADLNDIKLKPAIMNGEFQGGLCYMTLDVSETQDIWVMNLDEYIPFGEYNVTLVNPAAGNVTYPDNLFITP